MGQKNSNQTLINNEFYDTLGDRWYTDSDHPVALLRAENDVRGIWIAEKINDMVGEYAKVLDVGCGAGLLSNYLSEKGHKVTGIDLSEPSLDVARRFDKTGKVIYQHANAYELPFPDCSFDVVCATDILEHVEDPGLLIKESSRVLRPGGIFFFHTFNRNFFSKLVVIKGVDWFVNNAPKYMHVYELFIKPKELKMMLSDYRLQLNELVGLIPKVNSLAFWRMIFTKRVPSNFQFVFSKSTATGYCGIARKEQN